MPELKAPALVEVREMDGEQGKLVFLFNHREKAAGVEFAEDLEKSASSVREIVSGGQDGKARGRTFSVKTEVPAGSVRIWRIDY